MLIEGGESLRPEQVVAVDVPSRWFDDLRSALASAHRIRVQRALVFCVCAILFAVMAYVAATYGLSAVVRCEVETNTALGHGRSATSQIALSSGCGF
jgi:hypothetical protein